MKLSTASQILDLAERLSDETDKPIRECLDALHRAATELSKHD